MAFDGKYTRFWGGYYIDKNDAARKANELMLKVHGEFACLNVIPDTLE